MRVSLGLVGFALLVGAGCLSRSEDTLPVVDVPQEEVGENILSGAEAAVEDVEQESAQVSEAATVPVELAPIFVSMTATNFVFSPNAITAQPGQSVVISFQSSGVHTFTIEDLGIHEEVRNGTVLTFTAPDVAGDYVYYCSQGSHHALGMEGTLSVAP